MQDGDLVTPHESKAQLDAVVNKPTLNNNNNKEEWNFDQATVNWLKRPFHCSFMSKLQ